MFDVQVGTEAPALPVLLIGELRGSDAENRPLVQLEDGRRMTAQVVCSQGAKVNWQASAGRKVVVGLLGAQQDAIAILGFVDAPVIEATCDGGTAERVHLEAKRELVLECGKARISLRADGQIKILGGTVVSRATEANKIRGGSVQIN